MAEKMMRRVARLGLSPRQQQLNRLWSFYRCCQYDARRVDWDGRERLDGVDHDAIAHGGFIPPGFYDAGATFPLKFRRPTAPYNLVRVIVDRLTGLLFSENRHPRLRSEGDPATEDYVAALAEAARLWQAMIRARTFGGATGTAVAGFQFVEGRPVVEVHDPRWIVPEWADRATLRLAAIEKRYVYPIEVLDRETGAWVAEPHWYRRVVDQERDVLWKPVPVGDGDEPDWEDESLVERAVEHKHGFCPVVWAQNLPVEDDVDGDPDCVGVYDMVETVDGLLAQANRGVLANVDPTVVIVSPDQLPEVRKGNENAIKLTAGSAGYMEANMAGPKQAVELAENLRKKVLEVAQVVLDHPEQVGAKTATEIRLVYSSMIAKADVLREQYGERMVKPLVEMMLKAARRATKPQVVGSEIVRGSIALPDRVVRAEGGVFRREPRRLGPNADEPLQAVWPDYFEPTLNDVELATRAAGEARQLGLIDLEHAAQKVAGYYGVEDVPGMLARAHRDRLAEADALAQGSLDQLNAGDGAAPEIEPDDAAEVARNQITLAPTDLAVIVTVNEARASAGLGPLGGPSAGDGELTVAEFKAKHGLVLARAAQAEDGELGMPQEAPPERAQSGGGGEDPRQG